MRIFVSIVGWALATCFFFIALFVFGCSRVDKKDKDGTWKVYFLMALFLFLVAAYCAVSAYLING